MRLILSLLLLSVSAQAKPFYRFTAGDMLDRLFGHLYQNVQMIVPGPVPGGGYPTPAFVQVVVCPTVDFTSGSSLTCSFGTTPTVGDFIFVSAVSESTTAAAAWNNASDNQASGGNTYTQFNYNLSGVTAYGQGFATVATKASGTFTVTVSKGSSTMLAMLIAEYTNVGSTSTDGTDAGSVNPPVNTGMNNFAIPCNNWHSGATTTGPNDLMVTVASTNGGIGAGGNLYQPSMIGASGFTIRTPALGGGYDHWILALADQIVSAGTYSPEWQGNPYYNSSGENDCNVLAWK